MVSEPGNKRRWVHQRLGRILKVPYNPPAPPKSINESDSQAQERFVVPTVQRPIIWPRGIDVDRLEKELGENFYSPDKDCLNEIIFYCDDQAPPKKPPSLNERPSSAHSEPHQNIPSAQETGRATSGQIVTKGLTAKFDSGADFSIIPKKTLTRLSKSYTSISSLHQKHVSRMTLMNVQNQVFTAVGIVSLLWYLNSFPDVLLSTTFYVVEDLYFDLLIGNDVSQAVRAAARQEKQRLNMGPRQRVANVVRSIGLLRRPSSGSLRTHPSPRHSQLTTVDETVAVPNGSAEYLGNHSTVT
ncbi:hypothetical protein LTR99_002532 [Exophiala xenobiotica]|uniref:Peptidase A2 domain-containing protein n=1 Tax=Vermiconidia calcicola TaxID=1690605 RepID=A0AAV9QHG0_9PEZI|nr:hypothetical protein LTR92_005358 [Exophiala xenobiotica]KAK5537197.1 hypothetical protein LTR23_007585 [Chaetothyriales sp. CCFEE 6169]KAK5542131.1 hypothetical protein LTR25_002016 [Vermiconidia calcicola]KAK5225684.1 hypothetical protein LTR72_003587 [Exophiala xenobiotica]KAK5273139.1 hypothetical protein LTR96_002771 [Exophiala xenobiotica]